MPQSERSQIIKDMLRWCLAYEKLNGKGPKYRNIISHVRREISEMGANIRTIKGYIRACQDEGLLGPIDSLNRIVVTQTGKNWLEKKVS